MSRARDPVRRYAKEAAGAFVLLSAALFVLAASQAGRVQEWLSPGITVKVLMPLEGLYGLSSGADVEILGTKAGSVREIVIDPAQTMHALVSLRREVTPFLRDDSAAYIKRRFGVAGNAYLEITRGAGAPLDLEYAVLSASGDRIPTQTVEQLISEVRKRALPILDQAERAIGALAEVATLINDSKGDIRRFVSTLANVSERIERGEGTFGRLLTDATPVDDLEQLLRSTESAMARLAPILTEMEAVTRNAAKTSANLAAQSAALPDVAERASSVLESLQVVMEDVRRTSPELPRITRNVARTTEELPRLVLQTRQAVAKIDALAEQLRDSWLLGGGGDNTPATEASRVSPLEVTP